MTSALYVQTRKEVRALLPWWLGVALATVVLSIVAHLRSLPFMRNEQMWFALAYLTGALGVAALSLGHELAHGTLSSILVQPISRRRVLWTKIGVLASLLFALGIIGEARFPAASSPTEIALRPLLIWGPVAIGIGLVPFLTLLTRKPVAGPVFGIVVPGLIYVISERFHPANSAAALNVAWYGTLIVSAIGFVAMAFLFPGAEVASEGQASSPSRAALTETPATPSVAGPGASPRKRSWVWLSIVKELRLQQLTLAVSGLFGLLCVGVVIVQRMDPLYAGPGISAGAVLHGVFVAMIAGSRASAEERHLGVLAAQTLHPRAAWQQWVLKVSVTLSLVLVLAIAMPWLFAQVTGDSTAGKSILRPGSYWFGLEPEYFVGVVLGAAAAMYVSTLSSNSLWALLGCVPAAAVILLVFSAVEPILRSLRQSVWLKLNLTITPAMEKNFRDPGWAVLWQQNRILSNVQDYLFIVLIGCFSFFVLYLAYRNHRTLERGARRLVLQTGMIAAFLVITLATYYGASHLAWSIIR